MGCTPFGIEWHSLSIMTPVHRCPRIVSFDLFYRRKWTSDGGRMAGRWLDGRGGPWWVGGWVPSRGTRGPYTPWVHPGLPCPYPPYRPRGPVHTRGHPNTRVGQMTISDNRHLRTCDVANRRRTMWTSRWDVHRDIPPSAAVVEGPGQGSDGGDALARAVVSPVQPTGTRQMY